MSILNKIPGINSYKSITHIPPDISKYDPLGVIAKQPETLKNLFQKGGGDFPNKQGLVYQPHYTNFRSLKEIINSQSLQLRNLGRWNFRNKISIFPRKPKIIKKINQLCQRSSQIIKRNVFSLG